MVIAPIAPTGLKALLPQASQNDRPTPALRSPDIVVTMSGDGAVRLNREPVPLADLHGRLLSLFRYHTNHVLFVRGEKGLEFQQIAQVIDIARGVGLDRVALMTW